MRLRLGVEESLSLEGYVREREEDVQRMIEFAVQCLQRTFERVKEERGSGVVGEEDHGGRREEEGEEIEEIACISPVSTR
ncbi:hypothetical protein NLJ89_g10489 [Agrocybe chaxingu]|uniref:Uncharacterized protein n=1 Tax=Agrocybe chaxingu TaxID=84603 RepID=A0A9W8JRN1_9AGAR|nr:hypothetical protein NLJ89_g10489 [Agrocybe chaxingu]